MKISKLKIQNRNFTNTGGVSRENAGLGFEPGFLDRESGQVYRSRWADGSPAPLHVLEGLPAHLVVERSSSGTIAEVKASIDAGFIRAGRFYTREQAAQVLGEG